MNLTITAASPASATDAPTHVRKVNFGAMVSAIHKGDMDAAKTAFDGLQNLDSSRFGDKRKQFFAALGNAIASGDPAAAKAALKSFHYVKATPTVPEVPADAAPAPATAPAAGSTVDILV